jgi:uncharacterized protein YecE (DUF72 family)
MEIRAGTSGYSYPAWRGTFYPEKLAPAAMLVYYTGQLPAVEINNTFYRMPTRDVVETWAQSAPVSFRFAVKVSQRITHRKRLVDVQDDLDYLLAQLEPLGARLGALLVQLPPNLPADLERLERFLAHLAGRARPAFEFRHASWLSEPVLACLREHGAALVASESDEAAATCEVTARFGYLRLRRDVYAPGDLAEWVARVRATAWDEAFVFFKHEDAGKGPALAARLIERLGDAARR